MEYSEDHIALAAEYALGTLDADERAQVETMMAVDKDFTAIVQAWEFRLGVLNQMVGSVEPPPGLWDKISKAVGLTGQQPAAQPPSLLSSEEPPPMPATPTPLSQISEAVASMEDAFAVPPPPPPSPPLEAAPLPPVPPPMAAAPEVEPGPEFDFTPEFRPAPAAAASVDSNVVRLSGRVKAYRSLAVAMTAIAAALLAIIGVQVISPGLLPGLGGKPVTQIVEVRPTATPQPAPTLAPSSQYVALLQGAAGGPAFILTIDGASKNFTVRKLGAPPIDPSKNYELWLISDKLQNRPRSLGVIGDANFTTRAMLAGYDADVVNGATYAVTVEQQGGSPDGAPHSQPVFIGKLFETVPANAAPAPAPTRNR
jgi:anti-sigma-K factor RskA